MKFIEPGDIFSNPKSISISIASDNDTTEREILKLFTVAGLVQKLFSVRGTLVQPNAMFGHYSSTPFNRKEKHSALSSIMFHITFRQI